jgi:hypothetical protein
MAKIYEERRSDISTVYGIKSDGSRDKWSCFDGEYQVGEEYKMIDKLETEFPNKYEYYSICWDNCN